MISPRTRRKNAIEADVPGWFLVLGDTCIPYSAAEVPPRFTDLLAGLRNNDINKRIFFTGNMGSTELCPLLNSILSCDAIRLHSVKGDLPLLRSQMDFADEDQKSEVKDQGNVTLDLFPNLETEETCSFQSGPLTFAMIHGHQFVEYPVQRGESGVTYDSDFGLPVASVSGMSMISSPFCWFPDADIIFCGSKAPHVCMLSHDKHQIVLRPGSATGNFVSDYSADAEISTPARIEQSIFPENSSIDVNTPESAHGDCSDIKKTDSNHSNPLHDSANKLLQDSYIHGSENPCEQEKEHTSSCQSPELSPNQAGSEIDSKLFENREEKKEGSVVANFPTEENAGPAEDPTTPDPTAGAKSYLDSGDVSQALKNFENQSNGLFEAKPSFLLIRLGTRLIKLNRDLEMAKNGSPNRDNESGAQCEDSGESPQDDDVGMLVFRYTLNAEGEESVERYDLTNWIDYIVGLKIQNIQAGRQPIPSK